MRTLVVIEARSKSLYGPFLEQSLDLCRTAITNVAELLPGNTTIVVSEDREYADVFNASSIDAMCIHSSSYWKEPTTFLRVARSKELSPYFENHTHIFVMPEAAAEHLEATLPAVRKLFDKNDSVLVTAVEEMRDNPCQYKSYRTLCDVGLLHAREQNPAMYSELGLEIGQTFLTTPFTGSEKWSAAYAKEMDTHAQIFDLGDGKDVRIAYNLADRQKKTGAVAMAFDARLKPCAAVYEADNSLDIIVHEAAPNLLDERLRLTLPVFEGSTDIPGSLPHAPHGERAGFLLPCDWRKKTPVAYILSTSADGMVADFQEDIVIPKEYELSRFSSQAFNTRSNTHIHGRQAYPDLYSLNNAVALFRTSVGDSLTKAVESGAAIGFVHPLNDPLLALIDRDSPYRDAHGEQGETFQPENAALSMVYEHISATLNHHQAPLLFNLLKPSKIYGTPASPRKTKNFSAHFAGAFGKKHLDKPVAAALLPTGDILVTDIRANSVVRFNPRHKYKDKARLEAKALFASFRDESRDLWLSDIACGNLFKVEATGEIAGPFSLMERSVSLAGHINVLDACPHNGSMFFLLAGENPLKQIVVKMSLKDTLPPTIINSNVVTRGSALTSHNGRLLLSGFDSRTLYALDEETSSFMIWDNNLPFDVRHLLSHDGTLFMSSTSEVWLLGEDDIPALLFDFKAERKTRNCSISALAMQSTGTLLCVDKGQKQVLALSLVRCEDEVSQ